MRNLAEYPVTYDEVIQSLKDMKESYDYRTTKLIGDMRPTILSYLLEYLDDISVHEDFEDWVNWKNETDH